MPFDWKAFLDLARGMEKLAGSAPNPEAVSRAYFAAFGHACEYAKHFLQFDQRNESDDHGRIRAHLKMKRRKGDSDRLETLRQMRNEADYWQELPWDDIANAVASAIALAERVFLSLAAPKKA